jgi:hypothetical protein
MHIPPLDPTGVRNGAFASRSEAAKLLARLAEGGVDLSKEVADVGDPGSTGRVEAEVERVPEADAKISPRLPAWPKNGLSDGIVPSRLSRTTLPRAFRSCA